MIIGLLVTVLWFFVVVFFSFSFSKGTVNLYNHFKQQDISSRIWYKHPSAKVKGKISWLFLIFTICQVNIDLDKKSIVDSDFGLK